MSIHISYRYEMLNSLFVLELVRENVVIDINIQNDQSKLYKGKFVFYQLLGEKIYKVNEIIIQCHLFL